MFQMSHIQQSLWKSYYIHVHVMQSWARYGAPSRTTRWTTASYTTTSCIIIQPRYVCTGCSRSSMRRCYVVERRRKLVKNLATNGEALASSLSLICVMNMHTYMMLHVIWLMRRMIAHVLLLVMLVLCKVGCAARHVHRMCAEHAHTHSSYASHAYARAVCLVYQSSSVLCGCVCVLHVCACCALRQRLVAAASQTHASRLLYSMSRCARDTMRLLCDADTAQMITLHK